MSVSPKVLAVLLSALPLIAQAQLRAAKTDTAYYDAKAQLLTSRVGAVRCIVTEPLPTGSVQKIYSASGRLLEQIPYSDAQATVREGVALTWFPTGELKGRRVYKAGQPQGQLLLYYPNGSLEQLKVYDRGDLKSQHCFSEDGQPMSCPSERQPKTLERPLGKTYAYYRRGPEGLAMEVRKTVRYPRLPDQEEPVRGQVIVASMIGVDGRLRESRIYKSLGPAYDQEALRVVKGLQGGWVPEVIDGEPMESFYTIEVDFLPRP